MVKKKRKKTAELNQHSRDLRMSRLVLSSCSQVVALLWKRLET